MKNMAEAAQSNSIASKGTIPNGVKSKTPVSLPNDPLTKRFHGFMGSQLDELEKSLNEQLTVFDDLTKKWNDERDARVKQRAQEHVPQLLKNSGQSLDQISMRIGGLFQYTNFAERYSEKSKKYDPLADARLAIEEFKKEMTNLGAEAAGESPITEEEKDEDDDEFLTDELRQSSLPEMSELDRTLIIAHSLAAYVTKLPADHRERFYTRIINDTTFWLTSLFRIKDSTAIYHDEPCEGMISVARMAIAAKYPDYLQSGFDCLYSRPPVIYISEASPPGLAPALSTGLGLPMNCICKVPCKVSAPGQIDKIDVEQFESLVNDHITSTREPVMVIGYASTPKLATVDPLLKLKSLCKEKNIWLHVEGLNLAALVLMNVPCDMIPVSTSDSCTLDLASWFGFPGCPSVTFYKKESESIAQNLSLSLQSRSLRLKCFPLWVALQAVGVDGLVDRVTTAVKMTSIVMEKLAKIDSVTILNKKPKSSKGTETITSFNDLLGKIISTFEIDVAESENVIKSCVLLLVF